MLGNAALRELARERGDARYWPSDSCARNHYSQRYVSTNACIECKHHREKIRYQERKGRP